VLWLEMSLDDVHGGGDWSFGKCLWSPTEKKSNGGKWPFWEYMLSVQSGDPVVHLRGKNPSQAAFVGYSIAESDGFKTNDKPPEPGEWRECSSFYRIVLKDFVEFPEPILLKTLFSEKNHEMRNYYAQKKASNGRLGIFFVIQNGSLQRLNGAYLSIIDSELASIIFGNDFSQTNADVSASTPTAERIANLKVRVGQSDFSKSVRVNYGSKCCFPNCKIDEPQFLISSHIARWADVPELRGDVANGLCLCLLHDRAFELGLFTINENYLVTNETSQYRKLSSHWAKIHIDPYVGQPIQKSTKMPSVIALRHHWKRIGKED